MTSIPTAGLFTDVATTNGVAKQAQDDMLAVLRELLGGSAETTLTISAGSVTPISGSHAIDTEGAASSDDITHMAVTNHPTGRFILIRAANAARTVIVNHAAGGSGQILLADASDFSLDDIDMFLLVRLIGTTWEEIFRSYGNDFVAERAFRGTLASAGDNLTGALNEAEGAPVAAAATTDIWAGDGNTRHITGSGGPITSFGTAPQVGAWRKLIFDGAPTLTDGANLILPGGFDIVVEPGDIAFVYADTTTQFPIVFFPISGKAIIPDGKGWILVETITADGTSGKGGPSVDFTSGIDSSADDLALMISGAVLSVDDREIWVRISIAAAFKSGGSDYKHATSKHQSGSTATVVEQSGSDTKIIIAGVSSIADSVGNTAGKHFSGKLAIRNPASTSLYSLIRSKIDYIDADGDFATQDGGGTYIAGVQAVDGIQVLPESGNITAGEFSLFKLVK